MDHASATGDAAEDRSPLPLVFFLGGRDLEMATIRDLVVDTLGGAAVVDHGLGWGARASAYAAEIAAARAAEGRPVLVELMVDIDSGDAIVVDHHGDRAGGPTSLEQVFALLDLPADRWTRRMALVAANDRGHLQAMQAMGANLEEMAAIRREDRAAQGITAAEEAAGRAALAAAERVNDGRLLLVRSPHGRTATIADPLRLEEMAAGRPPRDLLIEAPAELAFFGTGAAVAALDSAFPGGWRGGDLPDRGFWGCARRAGMPDAAAAVAVLRQSGP